MSLCPAVEMRITCSEALAHPGRTMAEKRQEPMDLVRDFQEYLSQQTRHVNMISGPVDEEKEPRDLQAGKRKGGDALLAGQRGQTVRTLGQVARTFPDQGLALET